MFSFSPRNSIFFFLGLQHNEFLFQNSIPFFQMEETGIGAGEGETGKAAETGAKEGGETGQDDDLVASRVGKIVGLLATIWTI